MKPQFNHIIFTLLLFIAGILACNNSKQDGGNTADHADGIENHEAADHVHTYACPMHPEMQGHEGEKCNICGMPLEHMDHAPVAGNFKMEYKSSAANIMAGKPVSLSFIPKNKDHANALVPLDVEHEKKIHLIIVSEDLSWFDHIHPEFQEDGSYVVSETFPNGGRYVLYADYKPSGSTHQLEKIEVQVEGTSKPSVSFSTPKTNAISGKYAVLLKPDDPQFVSNKEIHFDGQFTKGGKRYDVNNLQSYLGAKGHMVGVHTRNLTYVHLHPEVENDILHFHATFPEPGMYRAWLQFMDEDQLHTVDFTIMVEQGNADDMEKEAHDDSHTDHKH